jgi:hypothetical protein
VLPHLDSQLTPPVHLRRRPRRLVNHEALDQHRVLGQLDERDLEIQLAHHCLEHVVEQPPNVRHGDPPLMVRVSGQPEIQRPQAAQHFRPRVIGGEIGAGSPDPAG